MMMIYWGKMLYEILSDGCQFKHRFYELSFLILGSEYGF